MNAFEKAALHELRDLVRAAYNLLDGTANDPPEVDPQDWQRLAQAVLKVQELIPESEQPAGPGHLVTMLLEPRPTHRHIKRGSDYVVVGVGKMQAEHWAQIDPNWVDGPLVSVDMREVMVYRDVNDGSLWVRPIEEFQDGRFEVIDHG